MRVSVTITTPTVPRARDGATCFSQDSRPRILRGRPCSSETSTFSSSRAITGELLVRLHDLLHELVTHDVAVVEVNERNSFDRADDLHGFDQARRASGGQIDLRDVAGDDGLRAKTEARQEHLHLLGRRVLRLV